MNSKSALYIYSFLSILILSQCQTGQADSTDIDWLTKATEAEKFIRHAQYNIPEGKTWRMMPDSLNSEAAISLYSGVPGIVLFYLELYNTAQNIEYLKQAEYGAEFLIGSIKDTTYRADEVGLYTGLSGIGYTLLEVYKVTHNPKIKQAVLKSINLIEESASESKSGINWGEMTDIIYGGAGVGLYLQRVADELDYPKADSLALLAANGLNDMAITSQAGWRWKFMPTYERFMDNFSHGTAGVGYFLSETYRRSGDEKYLAAALGAAGILDSLENEQGFIPHHCPGGEELFYLNWCHGPAGTSRLYFSLYKATNDKKWLKKIESVAGELMKEDIHIHQQEGYWNNCGKCCGDAGVAEYYLWLYEITGKQVYLDYSVTMTQKLSESASQENNIVRWIHAEHRSMPDYVAAQSGLMQGSAGIGLWFLQLDAFLNSRKPSIILPDKPLPE